MMGQDSFIARIFIGDDLFTPVQLCSPVRLEIWYFLHPHVRRPTGHYSSKGIHEALFARYSFLQRQSYLRPVMLKVVAHHLEKPK